MVKEAFSDVAGEGILRCLYREMSNIQVSSEDCLKIDEVGKLLGGHVTALDPAGDNCAPQDTAGEAGSLLLCIYNGTDIIVRSVTLLVQNTLQLSVDCSRCLYTVW